jgi:hypothetical protein
VWTTGYEIPTAAGRLARPAAVTRRRFLSIVVCGALALLLLEVALVSFLDTGVGPWAGIDYQMYMEAAYRFLHGDGYFLPHQLAGPYRIALGDVLYPPIALWLFVPFMGLPSFLWWVIPIGVTLAVVYRLRPAPWTWPLLALCVAWPTTSVKLFTGNPVMWAMMAMALGVLYRWPSVFVAFKASLFPFALFGIWHRSWWKAAGVFVLLSLPFGTLWLDWLRSLLNSTGGGLAYSVMEVPMLLFPLIAWTGRTREADARTTPDAGKPDPMRLVWRSVARRLHLRPVRMARTHHT